ncbi:hypothetical protein [Paenibacillus donghaensis]|uniref:Virion structural protein n=1 Tax=Paenibacillus donghaensis TaxID=414771 RepID=A0A2Z2KAV4_9BACL|nr:hypothetical protein [Paenibacillus donghaensis]ASA22784.1 hypothetical protein B9T62_19445 [Paenibacillus donghaensis]
MTVPATAGVLRERLSDMKVGDYIVCKYVATNGAVGTFSELGTSVATEIPVTGAAIPNGIFYFVKTNKGLLFSDRVVQTNISWDVLNAEKAIQGKPQTFDMTVGTLRSLSGGVAWADENGNSSTTDKGFGAWPANNEWDRYIVGFPSNLIQTGKTLYDVFNHYDAFSWTQDTPISIIAASTLRTIRTRNTINRNISNGIPTNVGFRPAFEYKE